MYRLLLSLIALIVVIIILGKSGLQSLLQNFISLNWYWVVCLVSIALFNHIITVFRFYLITQSYKKDTLGFFEIFKVNFIGLFLGYWTPISIIGDGYRTLWLRNKLCENYNHALSMVILDRLISLAGICVFCILFIPLYFHYIPLNNILIYSTVGTLLTLFLIALLYIKRELTWSNKIFKFCKNIKFITHNREYYKYHLMIAFLYIFSYFGLLASASYAVNLKVDMLQLLAFAPIIFFIQNIPISFGGFGSRELTLLFLFGNVANNPSIISMSLTVGLSIILASLPGGIFLTLVPNFTSIFRRNTSESVNIRVD